jgi:excisionase family DNA binding protein
MHDVDAQCSLGVRAQTYAPEELAVMLNVSRQTVYKGLNNGVIPSIRLGRRFVIPKAAIEKWLESGGLNEG